MNAKNFAVGMGLGMIAGAAAALMLGNGCPKKSTRSKIGRCLRSVGDIVESISDAVGM